MDLIPQNSILYNNTVQEQRCSQDIFRWRKTKGIYCQQTCSERNAVNKVLWAEGERHQRKAWDIWNEGTAAEMVNCCCCCCCWVASVVSDSVWPHRRQPNRLPCPWDSPGKNTGVGCHFLLQCMKVISESEVAQLCLTLSDPMDSRLLRPWDFPGKSTGVGCHCLLRVNI